MRTEQQLHVNVCTTSVTDGEGKVAGVKLV